MSDSVNTNTEREENQSQSQGQGQDQEPDEVVPGPDYTFFAHHSLVLKGVEYPFFVRNKTQEIRFWDDLNLSEQKMVHKAGYYINVWDKGESVIRPMNDNEKEKYHNAVVIASRLARPFRDIIATLRPVVDRTARTAYVDEHARMGLGDLFFNEYDEFQRATAVLHESCHVLYRHFARARDVTQKMTSMVNIAQDFEINCGLRNLEDADTSAFVHPDDIYDLDMDHPLYQDKHGQRVWPEECKPHMTFEQHYSILREDDNEEDPNCPVHGEEGEESDKAGDESGEGESGPAEGGGADGEAGEESGEESDSEDGESQEGSGDGVQGQSEGSESSQGSETGNGSGNDSSEGSEGSGDGDDDTEGEAEEDAGCSCGPKTEGCGEVTDERTEGMDEAEIDKATDVEKDSAIRNTKERIIEEHKRKFGVGSGAGNDFLSFTLDKLQPPKVSWQAMLRNLTVRNTNQPTRGRGSYTYRRVNRRMSSYRDWRTGQKFIFPGTVTFVPKTMLGIDTSGSMKGEDFRPTLNEVEGVIKSIPRAAHGLSVFNVDTEISSVQQVRSVHDIDLTGGGGTRMSAAFEYVNSLPGEEMPDLMVLATDGGLMSSDWTDIRDLITTPAATYRTIILVTQERAFDKVPESLKEVAYVLDISD